MHKSIGLVLVLGFVILLGVYVFADGNTQVSKGGNDVTDPVDAVNNTTMQSEILVRFNPDLWNTTALQHAAQASHEYIGATVEMDYEDLGLDGLQLVLLPPGMTVEEGTAYYESLPYVLYAEPNAVYTIESTSNQTEEKEDEKPVSTKAVNNTVENPLRLLVQFNVSAFSDTEKLNEFANTTHISLNATMVKDYTADGLSGLQLVELPDKMTLEEGVSAYSNQTPVLFVEPDYEVSIEKTDES